jgi:hypothetical protein
LSLLLLLLAIVAAVTSLAVCLWLPSVWTITATYSLSTVVVRNNLLKGGLPTISDSLT